MMRALIAGLGASALGIMLLLPLAAQEPPENAIEALQARMDAGEITLGFDENGHGRLRDVLKALDIPEESQVLPFSKSSLQFTHINPQHPRAVYFNDDISIGAVVDGDLLEIMVNNRKGGVAFYTLPTGRNETPRFRRESALCVACHALVGNRVVGWIVSDITTTNDGMPQFPVPTRPFTFTDHTTAFEDRWGGWYVTGTTGKMRHRGNVMSDPARPYDLPETEGLNLTDLSGHFDLKQTLQPSSDVVALMVLEHQTGFTNRAYALNILPDEDDLDRMALYMTFAEEVALPDPVKGNTRFAEGFAARGPRDAKGRSLRDFDLKKRLFRHPLSYMIYSTAFDALRPDTKAKLWQKLHEILRRTPEGREAIAIAAATKPDIPDSWKTP